MSADRRMTARSTRHSLTLKLGRQLAVEVTETPTAIYLQISGDKPRPSDLPAVYDFLWPIVSVYENDDRPLDLDGVRNRGGARVLHTLGRDGDAVFLAVTERLRPASANA